MYEGLQDLEVLHTVWNLMMGVTMVVCISVVPDPMQLRVLMLSWSWAMWFITGMMCCLEVALGLAAELQACGYRAPKNKDFVPSWGQ